MGKDIGKAFEHNTTEEEREALRTQWAANQGKPQDTITHDLESSVAPSSPVNAVPDVRRSPSIGTGFGIQPSAANATTSTTLASSSSHPTPANSPAPASPQPIAKPSLKQTPEQRAEAEKYERQRKEDTLNRVNELTRKLLERIRPFVQAEKPGESGDPETERFAKGIRTEAEDLKLESFGVELLRLIGSVYFTKGLFTMSSMFPALDYVGPSCFVVTDVNLHSISIRYSNHVPQTASIQIPLFEFPRLT